MLLRSFKQSEAESSHERVGRVVVVVRLPDLPMRNLGKLEPGKGETHARTDVGWLWTEGLAVDQIVVFNIGREGGFD
jgi:hypothetical protein